MDYRKQAKLAMSGKAIDKLRQQLEEQGITISLNTDHGLDNVQFQRGDKIILMAAHSFYRYSGILYITRMKQGANNESESILVTDEMYLQTIIRPIIETLIEL